MKKINRRQFCQRLMMSSLAGTSIYGTLGSLSVANAFTRQQNFDDYKALVCIFLAGGNDAFNMLMPRSSQAYNVYAQARQSLAIPQQDMLPINPLTSDGTEYGVHPSMSGVQSLFESGDLSFIANLGALIQPVTRDEFLNNSAVTPPQLFSHSDQQDFWKSLQLPSNQRTGWAGRVSDLIMDTDAMLPLNISLSGTDLFQRGISSSAYGLSPGGVSRLYAIDDGNPDTVRRSQVFNDLLNENHQSLFARAFSGVQRNSMNLAGVIESGLENSTVNAPFVADPLGLSLRMVARMINARETFGNKRQVFYVVTGGFDTHGLQAIEQPQLLSSLSQNLKAFNDALSEIGITNEVTTFTNSEFGRTLTSNGDGTDHGWGGHSMVMGGAVNGRNIFGTMPDLSLNGPDDTIGGRIIPTTSVDEYGATLFKWFGLSDGELDLVFPNLHNFSNRDLGFLAS
ncbi:DUF1501 domain-containing protein [Aliikangiella marina]|uniref:DUF1501 domain-containing protein n=1 Tax=Aliikangiella marina TaxID=1712262 RepID=A0A545T6Y8_9GAMM|nr:DUF1501 domain-containing protein [Aliikangiella marina]TQV72991.1 DUF1501 domain-containing protein [Aliikangiella marina]